MKKVMFWGSLLGLFGGVLLFALILMALLGHSGGQPVPILADEETAYGYQYAGSELGTPWDMAMISDAIRAEEAGEASIEEYNPIITSLEFCKIYEEKYRQESHEKEDGTVSTEWVLDRTTYYVAADKILSYIGESKESLTYRQASYIVSAVQTAAEEKGDENTKYEAMLMPCENSVYIYEAVLRDYIGLSEANIAAVIELYDVQYMDKLYNYEFVANENWELPDVVVGDVTRDELIRVAASLMNHPYQLGGKSPYPGEPVGALDCSGYVDWVYIQCFGRGVGGGKIPAGVGVTGTAGQFYACKEIPEGALQPGDLGFLKDPKDVKTGYNHVGIYVGKIGGKNAWIHCGGSSFGYTDRPKGRVGISVSSGTNNINNVTGGTFSPEMKACNFRYFRRPNFQFAGESEMEESRRILCFPGTGKERMEDREDEMDKIAA